MIIILSQCNWLWFYLSPLYREHILIYEMALDLLESCSLWESNEICGYFQQIKKPTYTYGEWAKNCVLTSTMALLECSDLSSPKLRVKCIRSSQSGNHSRMQGWDKLSWLFPFILLYVSLPFLLGNILPLESQNLWSPGLSWFKTQIVLTHLAHCSPFPLSLSLSRSLSLFKVISLFM